ncbi:MAG: dihydrolipoamide acetyltransferase family protein [Candidatus Bathyarchaeia archaeon]
MVTFVKMPKSSLTMKEGTILKWYKQEGERVERGEPLVQILEEKSTIDLEATTTGVVKKLYYRENQDVPVDEVIAAIGAPEEELPEVKPTAEIGPTLEKPQTVVEAQRLEAVKPHIRASPLARKLAEEHGVDLTLIQGTGPGGRITESDVRRFLEERPPTAVEGRRVKETIPLTGMRKIVAEKMSLSRDTYPRITLIVEVDASEMKRFRERLRLFENIDVSYTDILVKAVAKALTRHPILNSTLTGNEVKVFQDVNIGVAVASPLGLVVPVIHGADNLTLTEIAKRSRELINKAREGRLTRQDVTGGTFTITNLGMYGVDLFTPIINPPETAILGVGRIRETPTVEEGRITIKPTMFLSLSVDHRVIDGAPAGEFMQTLKKIFEGIELVED